MKRRLLPHLEGTYNRAYRNLFPDVDGFRDALIANGVNLTDPETFQAGEEQADAVLGVPN